MGGPTTNPYQGQALPQQTQSAYTTALGQAGNAGAAGNQALGQANTYGSQAGGLFNMYGGYTPSDVTAGQLSSTNLQPYMDPYTQEVINTTMNDLNQQEGIAQQGIDDSALAQRAFGGDRMYVQKGVLGGEFARAKARTLADLRSGNFRNAQAMGQYDIGNRLNADQFNNDWRSRLFGSAGSGLAGLASTAGQLGSNMSQYGTSALGDLSNMGFGFGNQLQQNQLAAGALQQQQQQQLMDAIHAQYLGYAGSPQNSLSSYLGAILNPSGYGSQSTNPGLFSYIGAGTNLIGALNPFGTPS